MRCIISASFALPAEGCFGVSSQMFPVFFYQISSQIFPVCFSQNTTAKVFSETLRAPSWAQDLHACAGEQTAAGGETWCARNFNLPL